MSMVWVELLAVKFSGGESEAKRKKTHNISHTHSTQPCCLPVSIVCPVCLARGPVPFTVEADRNTSYVA